MSKRNRSTPTESPARASDAPRTSRPASRAAPPAHPESLDSFTSPVQQLFDIAPVPLFFATFDGVLVDVNRAGEALIGLTREQMVGHNVWDDDSLAIDAPYRDEMMAAWRARRAITDVPTRVRRPDGEVLHIRKRFEPFTHHGIEGMLFAAIDTTEREATESALQRSEELFAKAFRGSPMAMMLGWYDGTLIDVNPEAELLTGYSREELIGHRPADLGLWYYPPDDPRDKVLERFDREGRLQALSSQLIRKDGEWRHVYVSSERVMLGDTPAILSLILDITGQRVTEQALASSEERFRKAFNASPIAIAITSLETGVISDVNERFLAIFKGTREQIVGSDGLRLDLWVNWNERKRAYAAVIQGERYTSGLTTFRRLTGETFPGIFSFDGIEVDGTLRALIHIQDLTDLEAIRADLAQGEARMRTLLSHGRDVVGIINTDYSVELVSANAAPFLGYDTLTADDIVIPEMHHPDDIGRILTAMKEVRQRPGDSWRFEHRMRRGDGTWQWVETTVTNLNDEPAIGGILFSLHDISERRSAEEALRIRDRATAALSSGLVIIDAQEPALPLISVNPAFARMLGANEQELIGLPLETFAAQHLTDDGQAVLKRLLAQPAEASGAVMFRRTDGTHVSTDARFSPVRDQLDTVTHHVGIVQDVTERLAAEQELRLRSLLLDEAPAAIFALTSDGVITHWNTQAEALLGWPRSEAIGARLSDLVDAGSFHLLARTMLDHALQGKRWEGEAQLPGPNGDETEIQATSTPISELGGRGPGMVAVIVDITDRKRAEAELQRLAVNDQLTGLANRNRFVERLQVALSTLDKGETAAIFFINLDQVRALNESLGHEHGDRAMQVAARRLEEVVGSLGLVARFSGDTFSVVIDACTAAEADGLAGRMHQTLQAPLEILGRNRFIGAHVGYTLAGAGKPVSTIMSEADTAQREARMRRPSEPVRFRAEMAARAQRRLDLETDLRQAIATGHFLLHYQPIVSLSARTVVASEALIRWQQGDGTIVLPGEFIPLAEEIGLIVPIGQWVLEEACRAIRRWDLALGERTAPGVHINISADQFRQPDFAETVMRTIQLFNVDPARLTLEVTETMAMTDAEQAVRQSRALRDVGVRLALDDFGAGYSNLGLLNKLPVQMLKIDRSFARELETEPGIGVITRSLVAIGSNLGMVVTGEGIETAEQADRLASYGATRGQGFFFARPMAEAEYLDLLALGPSARLPR